MRPSGLTNVYCIDKLFKYDNCFFYFKPENYNGKVTLNIVNMPVNIGELDEYFGYCNNVSACVSSQKDVNFSYAIFPINLMIFKNSVDVKPIAIPSGFSPQVVLYVSVKNDQSEDNFLNLFNYFHSDAEGIVIKKNYGCWTKINLSS